MKKNVLIALLLAISLAFAAVILSPNLQTDSSKESAVENVFQSDQRGAQTNTTASTVSQSNVTPDETQQAEPATNPCTWRVDYRTNESGTTTPVRTCEKSETGVSDPYQSFSNQELADLAYDDAVAAETLALRLRDADEKTAMSLFLRAAALSGDGSPLIQYHNSYRYPEFQDGQPVLRGIRARYVLSSVSEFIDGEVRNSPRLRETIREHFDNPEAELARLNRQVNSFIEEMRNIQIEVSGTTTIREPGNG